MPIRTRKVGLPDGLAIAGGILTFLHEFLETVAEGDPTETSVTFPEGMRLLGLAIFLAGVWAVLHRVLDALDQMKEAHAIALGSLEVAESSRLLGEIDAWCSRDRDALHVRAARDVAMHLLNSYVPGVIRRVNASCSAAPQSAMIHVEDQSPVHDLLANLAEALPEGGVWLGITLLEHEKIWTEPDDAFWRFARTMRDRAQGRDIQVARIYQFSEPEMGRALAGLMDEEAAEGIHVRCTTQGSRQDISILYAPPADTDHRLELPLGDKLIDDLRKAGYRPLCTAWFKTRDDGAIREATLYGPMHPRTEVLTAEFREHWRVARPYREWLSGSPPSPPDVESGERAVHPPPNC